MNSSTWQLADQSLSIEITHGESSLEAVVTDKTSGRIWGPVPLLELEIYSKAEFRANLVKQYRIDLVEQEEHGLHVSIGHNYWGVRVGLWLSVLDGELVVKMPVAEVYEDQIKTKRLLGVHVLPGLLDADPDDQMLLPLNTGCLCSPRDKPALSDRFMFYGEQNRWELMPMLPVAAVHGKNGGMMVLASEAAAEVECHVATDGRGHGHFTMGLTLRQDWPDPVDWPTRELRYRFIPSEDHLLEHVANRLRKHLTEDLHKPTIEQRIKESPELAYMVDGYTMKLFFGVEHCGIMMLNEEKKGTVSFQRAMTFAQAQAGLRRLHEAGIDRIYTQSVGWNPNGHDGLYPTVWPIEERLGGERGFRQLIQAGKDMGYRMHVHDDRVFSVERSPDHQVDQLIFDMWGQPMGLGEWGGGTAFTPNTLLQTDEQLLAHYDKLKSLGLDGMGYLDAMGSPLYRNYHPNARFGRSTYATMINRLIELARRSYGSAGTECGFFYCAAVADSVCTGGEQFHWDACWPQWDITQMMDQRVPLYRMVFSGFVFEERQGIAWEDVMHAVLFGKHLRDEWSMEPGVMPILTDDRVAKLKACYDVAYKQFGHLQLQPITKWSEEGATQRTQFADGTEVTADFEAGRLFVNGQEIDCPVALQEKACQPC